MVATRAPATVARRLALHTTSLGGIPGDEETCVDECRSRLKGLPRKATTEQQQGWLAWGLVPVVEYVLAVFTLNALTAMRDRDFSDLLFVMLRIITTRMKILEKYQAVIDDELIWNDLCRNLVGHRDGTRIANPLYAPLNAARRFARPPQARRWCARKTAGYVLGHLLILGCGSVAVYFGESERTRVQVAVAAFC